MRAELVESIRAAIEEAQRQADATGREVVLIAVTPAAVPELKTFDRTWKAEFLEHLRAGRAVKIAAELSGISPRHVYRCRREDPRFAAAWSAAKMSRVTSQRSHRARNSLAS